MIITVVGLGVIGGSFVKALKDLGHQVYGIDIDQKTLKSAKAVSYTHLDVYKRQGLVIKLVLDNKEDKGLYPLGRQYLEYAFIEDRYDVQILDEKGNDITEKFIEENKKYYKTGDWDTIMENFVKESGSMSTADKYIDDN